MRASMASMLSRILPRPAPAGVAGAILIAGFAFLGFAFGLALHAMASLEIAA